MSHALAQADGGSGETMFDQAWGAIVQFGKGNGH